MPQIQADEIKKAITEHTPDYWKLSYSPQLNPDEYLNNILKKNVHSGDLPHTEKQIEKKTTDFMNSLLTQSEKISNLFLQEKLSFIEMCFVA